MSYISFKHMSNTSFSRIEIIIILRKNRRDGKRIYCRQTDSEFSCIEQIKIKNKIFETTNDLHLISILRAT